MSHNAVQVTTQGDGIALITMQDKKNRNTFSNELKDELTQAFHHIYHACEYKVVILTGFDSYFCSGGTKDELMSFADGDGDFMDSDLQSLPLNCPIPVISAMQGHAIGGGFVMGMFADFIVLSRESIFTANFMKFGFTPGMGATLILPFKLGNNLANEMMFTANNYRGGELEKRGVDLPVLPRGEVLDYSFELARSLANKPRISLVTLKDHMTSSLRNDLVEFTNKELNMHKKTFPLPETKARIESLL